MTSISSVPALSLTLYWSESWSSPSWVISTVTPSWAASNSEILSLTMSVQTWLASVTRRVCSPPPPPSPSAEQPARRPVASAATATAAVVTLIERCFTASPFRWFAPYVAARAVQVDHPIALLDRITPINNTSNLKWHGSSTEDAMTHPAEHTRRLAVELNLAGHVGIVTGVGKGIGREILLTLAREGVSTVALDINPDDLASLATELADIGGEHAQYVCDVRDRARIAEIVADVDTRFGRIDLLVNNAGVGGDGLVSEL